MEIKWGYPGIDCIFIADTARVLTRMLFHSFPGRCVFCSVLDLLCPLFVCCFLCCLFLGFVCLVHFSSDVLPCILWQFSRCAQDWPSWLQFEPQVSVVLSHSTMDYYHWNGYEQRTLWSHHFVQVHQHKGFYPLHRLCKRSEVSFDPFAFLEAKLWIQNERWNVVWIENSHWVPPDELTVSYGPLPHGFCRLKPDGMAEDFKHTWINWNLMMEIWLEQNGTNMRVYNL